MKCTDCVYSLFAPLWICLSPKASRNKHIYKQSECNCGDYTQKQASKLKNAIQIERLKDALKPKGD